MKKFIKSLMIAVVVLSSATISVNAQTAAEVEASTKRMMAASTPCNGAPEAFSAFIQKFSTDKDFMSSRIKLNDAQRSQFANLLEPSNFTAKVPFKKGDDEFYQMWGELQYNHAYLDCGWVDSFVEYIFNFNRGEGGKWYLTKIVADE